MTIKFLKRHNYVGSEGTFFNDVSKTQQQYMDECDVNKQIARLTRHLDSTGMSLTDYNNQGAMYGDFTEIPDFVTYNQKVVEAKEKFDNLPISVRQRFGNSPEALFDFLLDDNNRDEAVKLGLVNQPILDDIKQDIVTPQNDIKAPLGSSETSETP